MVAATPRTCSAIGLEDESIRDSTRATLNTEADAPFIELLQQAQDDAAQPLHILLVEDSPTDAELLRRVFAMAAGTRFELEHVESLALAMQHLSWGGIHLVLLDLGLPDAQGLEVVTRLHAAAPHVPIVVLTGLQDEQVGLAAILAGAQDYVVKGEMDNYLVVRSLRFARERHLVAQSLRMKSAELALANKKLQELNHQKDEFISRVSHELRTPLTAIYQFVTILSDGLAGDTTPEQREYLEIVLRNVKEIRNMVGELLDATRAETGKLHFQLRRMSIAPTIDETLVTARALAATKGIALLADVPRDLPPVHADPQRLRQVLINLLDNAIKFTPQNGSARVDVQVFDADPRFLCVSVQDTGEGLRPQSKEHLFERLYQDERGRESRRGLGLGLYICKQLVTGFGGRIWVEDHAGQGCRFSFTLPVFSLPTLLLPVLAPAGRLVDAVAVFRIEMAPARRVVSKRTQQTALRECRSLLASPAFPGTLVLPEIGHEDSTRILLIAAVDSDAAGGLAERLREKLAHDLSQSAGSLEPRVSFEHLVISSVPRSVQSQMGEIATILESMSVDDSAHAQLQ